jgi:PhoH-like ATPase
LSNSTAPKAFVLDTNVLLHDPNAISHFAENDVIVPIYVLEEIDTFKKDLSELGRNARQVARQLDDLKDEGSLSEGIELESGGLLKVVVTQKELPQGYQARNSTDNLIIATALDVREAGTHRAVIFVSKDVNLRIRAKALGLSVADYDADKQEVSELYSGTCEIMVNGEDIDRFYQEQEVRIDDQELAPHQFVLMRDEVHQTHSALGRYDEDTQTIRPVLHLKDGMWSVRPRNREQSFAADVLMNDNIKLVTLCGKAGTGKTLLAIAAGLQKVSEEQEYQRLLISRPIFPLGRDIGYLPGDVEEKLTPWMQPIFDNIEFLMGLSRNDRMQGRGYHELMDLGILEIEPLTYIRGRSIPNQFMVVDEAQNLTPHEVKTILSRAGDNTKIILTGDPYQIDNPYVDAMSNGLVHAVKRFRDTRIAAHVTLSKGERSELAELATNLL